MACFVLGMSARKVSTPFHENSPKHKRQIAQQGRKLTVIKEKTSLVKLGLEALIARESSKRLAKLGGTEIKWR